MFKKNIIDNHASIQELNDALGFEENVNDVPEASVNMFLGIFVLIATYLGVRISKSIN